MENEEIIKQINNKIILWSKEKDKLVVAIDGYTGLGKTTILKKLVEVNPEIISVNRDDFLFSRQEIEERLNKSKDRSSVFEREVNDDKKIEGLVNAFKNGEVSYSVFIRDSVSGKVEVKKIFDLSKRIMVIEGVFMFHPELGLNKLWDKRIYLHGDVSRIDERRVKREKEKWGKDYFPETHPDSYFRAVTTGLKRYIDLYSPEEIADLVIKIDY